MFKLCLTLILLGSTTQINCESLPAFIWGSNTPSYLPALKTLSGDEFATLVKAQTDDNTLTIVFVENNLSTEDLSTCKLKTETCFKNLRNIEQKTYLTSVEDPVKALRSAFDKHEQRRVELSNDGDFKGELGAHKNQKIMFVHLEDIEDSEDFATHDELMNKFYTSIAAERENVIAIYTGRHSSFIPSNTHIRKSRDTQAKQTPEEEKKQRFIQHDSFLFAFNGMRVGETEIDIETVEVIVANDSQAKTDLDVTIKAGTNELKLKLEVSGGTWWAPEITFNNERYISTVPISAYDGKSFGCVDLRFTNSKNYVFITRVQMQPRFDVEKPALTAFSDGWNDCVGFFSAAIWGALFVVILLLLILTTGISFMLDIRTMDRFDDPKGKTITINAQD